MLCTAQGHRQTVGWISHSPFQAGFTREKEPRAVKHCGGAVSHAGTGRARGSNV